MAEKDEDSLIGYDPLAWLHEADKASPADSPLPIELESEDHSAPDMPVDAINESLSAAVDSDVPHETSVTAEDEAKPATSGKIVLEASQTIRNVAELHERLLNALDNNQKLELDASAVTTIDTATLQLLLVLKQTSIQMQKEVSIEFPSEKFIEAADLLGLSEMLDVDQAFAGFF